MVIQALILPDIGIKKYTVHAALYKKLSTLFETNSLY